MTSEESSTKENEVLAKKIGALEEEVVTVKTVIRRASRTRLGILLAIVIVLGVSIWMFWNLGKRFASQENLALLKQRAMTRFDESRGPAMDNLQRLQKNCVPVLQEAFNAQVEKDKEKYTQAITEQREILVANLNKELEAKVQGHFEKIAEKYRHVLREEFPDLEDPELLDKMYASTVDIMERLAQEYYNDQVSSQVQEINDLWMEFEMAGDPAPDEPRLEQQFVAALLRVASMKLDKKLEIFEPKEEEQEEAEAPALAER